MARPRVVVFGYGSLALAGLSTLEEIGVTPVAVTLPGNRCGPDVEVIHEAASRRGWPLLTQPPRSRIAPFLESLALLQPDLLFVWSYSMLLPPPLIALPRLGAVNMHGGLLPQYRGGHVMNWAIANGERETGVTLHVIDAGIDTGPTIAERRVRIEWRDTAVTVRDKLCTAGQSLLKEWWPRIENGTAPRLPQDPGLARYYRMRTAADGRIDWSLPSESIYNLVRALVAPWPGARTTIDGTTLVVRAAEPLESAQSAKPGLIMSAGTDGVVVATGRGRLKMTAIEIEGRTATIDELTRAGVVTGAGLA